MEEYAPLIAVLVLWAVGLLAARIALRLLNRPERQSEQRTLAGYDVLAEADRVLASYQRCQEDSREC